MTRLFVIGKLNKNCRIYSKSGAGVLGPDEYVGNISECLICSKHRSWMSRAQRKRICNECYKHKLALFDPYKT